MRACWPAPSVFKRMTMASNRLCGRWESKKYALSRENTVALICSWNGDKKLPLIFVNPKVVVHKVASAKILHKLFIMSDDYKLKVPLQVSGSYNSEKKNQDNEWSWNRNKRMHTNVYDNGFAKHITTNQPWPHYNNSNKHLKTRLKLTKLTGWPDSRCCLHLNL